MLEKLREIRAFFRVLHGEYDKAFCQDDLIGVIKVSGELSAAYSILGNMPLANKWDEEHKSNLAKLNLERRSSN